MEIHRDTELKTHCDFVNGHFHYAEITPESENYESQFNYYFRILWFSEGVNPIVVKNVKSFVFIKKKNTSGLIFNYDNRIMGVALEGFCFDSLLVQYRDSGLSRFFHEYPHSPIQRWRCWMSGHFFDAQTRWFNEETNEF